MVGTGIRAALAGAALAVALVPGIASAQADGDVPYAPHHSRVARNDGYNPNEGLQPNGCVKQCPFDMNPCDPPDFKRADGRCTLDGR